MAWSCRPSFGDLTIWHSKIDLVCEVAEGTFAADGDIAWVDAANATRAIYKLERH